MAVAPALARKLAAARARAEKAAEAAAQADDERLALCREAVAAGGSLREVSALAGVSHEQVRKATLGRAGRGRGAP